MSKQVKQMEMDELSRTFQKVRDLVVLHMSGFIAQEDHTLRKTLRKKQIFLRRIKNSFAQKVFERLGMPLSTLQGPTVLAWGSSSLSELSRELETLLKKNEKVKFKGALADGQEVTFEQALKMPTRAEAIGRVLNLILSPAARLASQILAPGSIVAGAVKSLSEKKPEETPAASAPLAGGG